MSRISIIGNVNIDLVVWPAAELPPPDAEVQVVTIGMRAAGSARNSALALAHLDQAPSLAGCVERITSDGLSSKSSLLRVSKEGYPFCPRSPRG